MPIKEDEVIEYMEIDGKKVPKVVVPATVTIVHSETGKEYASDEEAQADVDDPNTQTQTKHILRHVTIEVARIKDLLSEGGL
jgi:hypothetical protein